jgi:hypothetical protein
MMHRFCCVLLTLCIASVHCSTPAAYSKSDSDVEPDSIDREYWDMVQGFLGQGAKGSSLLLFENIVTCNVCHAVVKHLRPFLLKKIPDETIILTMKKRYCRPDNLRKIEDLTQSEVFLASSFSFHFILFHFTIPFVYFHIFHSFLFYHSFSYSFLLLLTM